MSRVPAPVGNIAPEKRFRAYISISCLCAMQAVVYLCLRVKRKNQNPTVSYNIIYYDTHDNRPRRVFRFLIANDRAAFQKKKI
jgi:hypothetical protein